MNDCLVTTLKGESSNDNLPILGAFVFNVKEKTITSSDQQRLQIENTKECVVSVIGSGYFGEDNVSNIETQHLTTITIPANTSKILYFKNGNYKVCISEKYALYTLVLKDNSILVGDISGLEYSKQLRYIDMPSNDTEGNIDALKGLTSLIRLDVGSTKVNGDIASLGALTALQVLSISGTDISGDIAGIGNLSSVSSLSCNNNKVVGDIDDLGGLTSLSAFYPNFRMMGGTVEGFVASQISHGRTSVTTSSPIFIGNLLKFATFGGNNYNEGNNLVTWESTSKIVIYAGGGSVANATDVYAKGASQSEITAWENAGKTVHVIS